MVGSTSKKSVLTGLMLVASLLGGSVQAKGPSGQESAATISVAEMPAQGAQVFDLIKRGGPFQHQQDGGVFGNRERLLPAKTRGYYLEYTVATPGLKHRGTRRIVCGGAPRTPDACYYTADHYASFRRIVP